MRHDSIRLSQVTIINDPMQPLFESKLLSPKVVDDNLKQKMRKKVQSFITHHL